MVIWINTGPTYRIAGGLRQGCVVVVVGCRPVGARGAGPAAWIELAGHRLEEVAGSLGMAVLKDFALTLDYRGRRVQLRQRPRTVPR